MLIPQKTPIPEYFDKFDDIYYVMSLNDPSLFMAEVKKICKMIEFRNIDDTSMHEVHRCYLSIFFYCRPINAHVAKYNIYYTLCKRPL